MAATPTLSIGQLSERAGVPITTLRYYEKRGLIDPPARVSGQRRFDPGVVMRLMVIRFCQSAGLTLDEIETILRDTSAGRSVSRAIAARRVDAIDQQLEELALARLLMTSAIECSCPSVEACDCGAMDDAVAALLARLPSPED